MPTPAGIYLHVPFCRSRCSYCDFATEVWRDDDSVERYVDALKSEISNFRSLISDPEIVESSDLRSLIIDPEIIEPTPGSRDQINTIYFGGGTPSLLSAKQVERLLRSVYDRFDVTQNVEITLEMNPATVTPDKLRDYRSLGVNRASFGVQTFNDRDLKLLARGHDANDARETFQMLRDAGFANVSFDLIAGLPGQTIRDWERNLDEALSMQPEHLSLYLLEIHQGTPLAEQLRSGRRPMPDEDVAAQMYELLLDRTESAGYEQYEISNFARPDFGSRHNSKYWRLEPVFGFGVSAHSFDGVIRSWNERDTAKYVERIEAANSAEVGRETIDASSEYVFLGLRLTAGISLSEYRERFGDDLERSRTAQLAELSAAHLIEVSGDQLKLTRRGMLLSNEVFTALL